jgi:ABC-type antimicrobial peptide transport system permease subunit
MVLGRTAPAVVTGLAIGLAASIAASGTLEGLLYGLNPLDPIAYGGVLAVTLLASLAASSIPARRAARLDAVIALDQG